MSRLFACGIVCVLLACGSSTGRGPNDGGSQAGDGGAQNESDGGTPARPAPELGTGDGSPESVTFTEIATSRQRLNKPRDLAFNPLRPDELWVVNHGDESVVIVHDTSTDGRTTERRKDGYATHFMAQVSALAFGREETTTDPIPRGVGGLPGTFATCGESRNTYGGRAMPNDFMGATLWSSHPDVFARHNPNGLGSHLDMLHASPLCMGIAHERENVYWTFAGMSRVCGGSCVLRQGVASIVRYDFQTDDGVGNDDHGDGEAQQYATGLVSYVAGVPSHLAFNADDGMLFIADTGNKRIVKLDTGSGVVGRRLTPMEPMSEYRMMEEVILTDVVPESSGHLEKPSGIELRGEFIYVSDNANGRISAFKHDGERVNTLDTGLQAGALSGMAFGPDGKLYFVDMTGNRVLRIDP